MAESKLNKSTFPNQKIEVINTVGECRKIVKILKSYCKFKILLYNFKTYNIPISGIAWISMHLALTANGCMATIIIIGQLLCYS